MNIYLKHLEFFSRIQKLYRVKIFFSNLINPQNLGEYYPYTKEIKINISCAIKTVQEIVNITLHEFAHYWMHTRGPEIEGIHGEYLAEYFAILCLESDKAIAHKRALIYKETVLYEYKRVQYDYMYMERAKKALEDIYPTLRVLYLTTYIKEEL